MSIFGIFNRKPVVSAGPVANAGSGAVIVSPDPYKSLYNPTKNMTPERVVSMLDEYDQGRTTELEWLCRYAELMDADVMCVATRIDRGIQGLRWSVRPVEGTDPEIAKAQVAYLRSVYENIGNLESVIRFLAGYHMRGYAHTKIDASRAAVTLTPVDQWFMVRDGLTGPWAQNPQGRRIGYRDGVPINPMDYLICETQRPLVRMAVLKFMKASYNQRWWDRYNEIVSRQGIVVVGPESISDETAFREAASGIACGESGWLPNGSSVIQTNGQRSLQPYDSRLRNLQENFILAATGGLLTSLTAPTGLGSGVAQVQDTVWRSIIAGLALDIVQEFRRKIDVPLLAKAFKGQPVAAYFDLQTPEIQDRKASAEMLKAIRDAGFAVPVQVAKDMLGVEVGQQPIG